MLQLKEIFWKNGQFVDETQKPIKVEPIGEPETFSSHFCNVISTRAYDTDKRCELSIITDHIKRICLIDESYSHINAYMKSATHLTHGNGSQENVDDNRFSTVVSFYKIV
jgi:hypothetical protein